MVDKKKILDSTSIKIKDFIDEDTGEITNKVIVLKNVLMDSGDKSAGEFPSGTIIPVLNTGGNYPLYMTSYSWWLPEKVAKQILVCAKEIVDYKSVLFPKKEFFKTQLGNADLNHDMLLSGTLDKISFIKYSNTIAKGRTKKILSEKIKGVNEEDVKFNPWLAEDLIDTYKLSNSQSIGAWLDKGATPKDEHRFLASRLNPQKGGVDVTVKLEGDEFYNRYVGGIKYYDDASLSALNSLSEEDYLKHPKDLTDKSLGGFAVADLIISPIVGKKYKNDTDRYYKWNVTAIRYTSLGDVYEGFVANNEGLFGDEAAPKPKEASTLDRVPDKDVNDETPWDGDIDSMSDF